MKFAPLLAFTCVFFLLGCQPVPSPGVTIINNDQILTLRTSEHLPARILEEADITFSSDDRILLNGFPIAVDQPIADFPVTLQVRRAVPLTIVTNEGEETVRSAAFTVAEALQEASIGLRAGDAVNPSAHTPISNSPITISPFSFLDLTVTSKGKTIALASSAQTVGEALAEAGIPLTGLDYSVPAENEALPSNGQIRVVRVTELLQLAQKPIPFESELQASADVPLDQTQILQPGETGLTVQRIRIRYEDGEEISRLTEDETLVRPPKTRILPTAPRWKSRARS